MFILIRSIAEIKVPCKLLGTLYLFGFNAFHKSSWIFYLLSHKESLLLHLPSSPTLSFWSTTKKILIGVAHVLSITKAKLFCQSPDLEGGKDSKN